MTPFAPMHCTPPMPEPATHPTVDAALAALGAEVAGLCAGRLARVAGTHALLLDGMPLPEPRVAGIGCWSTLHPEVAGEGWRGSLRTSIDALPFEDEAFAAVLVRFAPRLQVHDVARELARVLAPHGVMLLADLHPRSLWRAGAAPGPWLRALRGAGLEVSPPTRCGSPWPRARGAAGVPDWLVRGFGGAWLLEARRAQAAIPLRRSAATRRAAEHSTLAPGARRQCA